MTSTQHTGIVVSAKEADAWHEQIKVIMAVHALNFGDAVDYYITSGHNLPVDMSGWDAA